MRKSPAKNSEYPLLLRVLLGIAFLFIGSLGILLVSLLLSMLGFVYGIEWFPAFTATMERVGILLLGASILAGGFVSMMGLATRSLHADSHTLEKEKNESASYDIREHGLTVEEVLDEMTQGERNLLAQKLAESRLAIREDGTLIPVEQAEKLNKVERFIDG